MEIYENKTDGELLKIASEEVPAKARGAQIEMVRRLKDSIDKFNVNTEKYSRILVFLTLALFVFGAIQLLHNLFLEYAYFIYLLRFLFGVYILSLTYLIWKFELYKDVRK